MTPGEALAVLAEPRDRLAALWDMSGLARTMPAAASPGSPKWTAVAAALAVTDVPLAVDRALDERARDPKGRLGSTASSSPLAAWVAACAGSPRGTVLDPACGEGRFLATLADRDPGATLRLVGLDTSARALASAATRLLARGRDADLAQRSVLTAQAMASPTEG